MRQPDVDPAALREFLRRDLQGPGSWDLLRADDGVSTQVYRLRRGDIVLYLRLGEPQAGLAAEALVHELLAARGAKVPEVVHFDAFNELLERSVMVIAEIKGVDVGRCSSQRHVARVLHEAGRDLATINSIAVKGFGWIRRDEHQVGSLAGECETHHEFALAKFESQLALVEPLVGRGAARSLHEAVDSVGSRFATAQGRLAHGDFDATHIVQHEGRYSGVIDFGEIRGAHPLYDLAHFYLHESELLRQPALRHLVRGYGQVTPLPDDSMRTISVLSLLIGVSTLARILRRPAPAYKRFLVESMTRSLETFITSSP